MNEETTQAVLEKPKTQSKLETTLLKYFQNKEIAKERTEENKLLYEEIEELFENLGENEFVLPLPNGEFAHLHKKPRIREVLDKDGLAQTLQIAKDEIKTAWDFSMLTQQGKLTPKMIAEHTSTEVKVKLSASKKKRKPKKKKDQ